MVIRVGRQRLQFKGLGHCRKGSSKEDPSNQLTCRQKVSVWAKLISRESRSSQWKEQTQRTRGGSLSDTLEDQRRGTEGLEVSSRVIWDPCGEVGSPRSLERLWIWLWERSKAAGGLWGRGWPHIIFKITPLEALKIRCCSRWGQRNSLQSASQWNNLGKKQWWLGSRGSGERCNQLMHTKYLAPSLGQRKSLTTSSCYYYYCYLPICQAPGIQIPHVNHWPFGDWNEPAISSTLCGF